LEGVDLFLLDACQLPVFVYNLCHRQEAVGPVIQGGGLQTGDEDVFFNLRVHKFPVL